MRRNILQAGVEKRVGVRAVTVVAHQGAVAALRVVELAAREAVVDDDERAAAQASAGRAHPRFGAQADFAAVAGR